jgi:hypothetical protein
MYVCTVDTFEHVYIHCIQALYQSIPPWLVSHPLCSIFSNFDENLMSFLFSYFDTIYFA